MTRRAWMHQETGELRAHHPREYGLDPDEWVLMVAIEDVMKRVPSPPAASDRSDYAQGRDDFRYEMLDALDKLEDVR